MDIANSTRKGTRRFIAKNLSDELQTEEQSSIASSFTGFEEDPIVDKLRTQLGVIHPIPSPPINRNIFGLFVFFFFVGVVFDKLWTSRKRRNSNNNKGGFRGAGGVWPQVPTSFSLLLEKDLMRKESVEWVNMVLGKLWKVYRGGIENWIIGLLQPVIDNLKKPDYVQRVEIKQFSLGDEPLSVRNVERRTSRRVNDLQYQIGLRYTGGARMLLLLTLKFGIIPIVVPVGVRDFDIDGELWVKLRLIPTEPWVGAVQWAFVSLPKIKFELSPFRLFNLMGKTDPYVVLTLGDQVIRSKKNSQTTVIGPPGEPIWNQDFHLLVENPKKQKLRIEVNDALGFADLAVGSGEVDLGSLQDTVPTDRVVTLQGGWQLLRKASAGEVLVRLTYKAYVEDEEDDTTEVEPIDTDISDDELSDFDEPNATFEETERESSSIADKDSFMDVLAALIVSEEFQGIVSSETGNGTKAKDDIPIPSTEAARSRSRGQSTEPLPTDPSDSSEESGGSALVWLAVITSIFVLIAINMEGSSLFNP
ncbi:hypothetical protein ACFE04_030489 [Oxalis oulophora]